MAKAEKRGPAAIHVDQYHIASQGSIQNLDLLMSNLGEIAASIAAELDIDPQTVSLEMCINWLSQNSLEGDQDPLNG